MKKKSIILSFLFLSLASFLGCTTHAGSITYAENITSGPADLTIISETSPVKKETTMYISVQGEIKKPGVYLLPEGSRVYELINQAGGVTESADTSTINMVYILEDGMQLIIPSKDSEELFIVSDDLTLTENDNTNSNSTLVNINTASIAELTTLTGIGDTRAKAIIAYRDNGGVFEKPEDLMKVSGIKSGIYEALKDQICVK